jgi:hypothetical protein
MITKAVELRGHFFYLFGAFQNEKRTGLPPARLVVLVG